MYGGPAGEYAGGRKQWIGETGAIDVIDKAFGCGLLSARKLRNRNLMNTFTLRDLRERTEELVRDAEAGQLSVVTKHGRPVFVAVPFDKTLVQSGVGLSLAIKLFKDDVLSVGKAAKLADCSIARFTEELSKQDIPVVQYSADELERELKAIG